VFLKMKEDSDLDVERGKRKRTSKSENKKPFA
jgi:hypothetical protein